MKGQEIRSARVTLKYRALAVKPPDEYLWFWIENFNKHRADFERVTEVFRDPLTLAIPCPGSGR